MKMREEPYILLSIVICSRYAEVPSNALSS